MCDIKISASQGYAFLSAALYTINELYLEGFRERITSLEARLSNLAGFWRQRCSARHS